ncbi:hypothetical protein BC938DRAFT_481416 [Jimgerdemannia flammicorona]|uniref:Transcriptional regulatory protein RXT2 N-terminal domain-containing protein n=1 Tax=Jimgerdemannia flammicorona TaxID=994334 RepID=A0A433QGF4_9FUNG|nr:hypothetical protein BC938DRAFT_481416 [Jimgerdemannia flammicorona]
MSSTLNPSARPTAKLSATVHPDYDPSSANHTNQGLPATAKWFQDIESEGSDSDSVGLVPHNRGYKYILLKRYLVIVKMGKKRTVIKRKRKRYDEWSDDEDPYSDIKVEGMLYRNASTNFRHAHMLARQHFFLPFYSPRSPPTDILSPLETPSDIVKRPSLRRILKSSQIEILARTSMEFIESEKNFNKILSRLSNIIQLDDPQYLDVRYDRENPTGSGPYGLNGFARARRSITPMVNGERGQGDSKESEGAGAGMDVTFLKRRFAIAEAWIKENINCSNEFLMRFHNARDKLTKAHLQKEQLWKQLKSKAAEQHKKSALSITAAGASSATGGPAGGGSSGSAHAGGSSGGAGGAGAGAAEKKEKERDGEREKERMGSGLGGGGGGNGGSGGAMQAYHGGGTGGSGGERG